MAELHPKLHAADAPERLALVMAGSGRGFTYAALESASNRSAHALRRMGLKRGDVVAFLFENGPEVFELGWAAQRSGLYSTSISNKLSAREIAYILNDCGAKLLVASDDLTVLAEAALDGRPDLAAYAVSRSTPRLGNWSEAIATEPTAPIADETPGTDLLYSSGTTGRPKGVAPSLPDEGADIGAPTALTRIGSALYGMGPATIYLSTSPLYHAAPLRWALAVQQIGGAVVVMERFDAEATLALIERYRITHATFVPTHFARLLHLPDEVRARYDLSSLKAVIHAAAPCPVPIKQAMIDWWGPIIHEYYSGTEGCGMTALSAQEWLRKPGSVGRSIVGQVKVLDEGGGELPAGEIGQIYFADGPRFSYLNDPEKTALAHNDRGWATLGDIGRLDEDGFLFLAERKDFMIISGGVNIYPQVIENQLMAHPKVLDAAVVGAPQPEMGEEVVAVVQPADWRDASESLAEELRSYVRGELGGVMTPRKIVFDRDFPREPNGKVRKSKVREEVLSLQGRWNGRTWLKLEPRVAEDADGAVG